MPIGGSILFSDYTARHPSNPMFRYTLEDLMDLNLLYNTYTIGESHTSVDLKPHPTENL